LVVLRYDRTAPPISSVAAESVREGPATVKLTTTTNVSVDGGAFSKIGSLRDEAKTEVLAFTAFPRAHRQKIWSTNPVGAA
jgi:hypothetical protein